MKRPVLSVVLPVHNERENLPPLLAEIVRALGDRAYEIIAVDDGSDDGSLDVLRRLRPQFPNLRVVAFRTQSGQSAALLAGCEIAQGDVVVTVDADGQNDPSEIPKLVERLASEPGVAAAIGFRVQRADSRWKRFQSRFANAMRNWITEDHVRDTGCGLKAVRRNVIEGLPRFDGMHRFLPTLIRLRGGCVIEVPVAHRPRAHGWSKYGMWGRAVRGLHDALAVRWMRRRVLHYVVEEDTD
jgi:glycosyltransferase involved in cell wall biosynthesis